MKKIGILIGLLLSTVLVILLFNRIDLARFSTAFLAANYLYILPIVLIVIAGAYLRALRWQWIIRPVKEMKLSNLFAATIIGYAANNLLPARTGEFVRAHAIGRMENASRAAAFATIVVERVFDGLSILVILVCVLPKLKIPVQDWLVAASWLSLLLYLAAIVFILFFNFKKRLALKLVNFLPARILKGFEPLADGFKIIENAGHLTVIAVYSFAIWAVTAVAIWLAALAFGCQLAYLSAVFILILMAFAVILPSAPGFIGTLDVAMVYGLTLFNVPRETALTMTVFYHSLSLLAIIVPGCYYLWKYKLSLAEL